MFDGRDGQIFSQQRAEASLPGSVRVVIDEESSAADTVATLLRIAHWIESEAAKRKEGK
jgi:hypothetical protein